MLNKRIASILVAGMVMVSMVGCQSTKGHVEYNDMRENPIESQYEDQDSKQGKEEKDLTVKEKREANDSAKEASNQTKQNPKAPKRYNPITDEYVGRYTDEEWDLWLMLFNQALEYYGDYDHDGQIDAKDPNETNQEYLDRQQNKEQDNYYDEDYWETDGDIPNGDYDDNDEPAVIEEQEDMRPECEKEYTPKVQEEEGEPEPELPPYVKENSKVTSDGNGNITITEPKQVEE